ncbi:FAD/FMN-containing dehydrogenase [Kribbella voronezhensis]|uniref:FAD/FMN-containing dehydrogenase n=1 Tax=Kribbella voronezhensis TaxID=2512212 RepID=A0A4V3FK04_9ACTN|nr:FAD-binding protein [Kribbella voronezhensis]TDU88303.1 FAD/FMN-containing dehydrogenase [Kribbella voronezhensis]
MIDELRSTITGPVLTRGDEGFTEEVAAHNTIAVHTPEVAVGAGSESDVAAAVRVAAKHAVPVRVLATGHGTTASTAVTDGILVTTSRLNDLTIDPETRIAHIGAGCAWAPVIAAAAEHGLAPITGASDTVGTIGYTLGGGLGPLARTYGFSSDWARGFRLVTASGEVISANATENPDLFWALRGGKGGFGVVTSMDFELVPLTTLYGGSLFYDAEYIAPVLNAWVDWTKTAPESASSSVAILRLPPLEFIPEPLRGKTLLNLRYAFVGDSAEGERLLQPLRDLAPRLIDGVAEMPAANIAQIHNDPRDPGPGWVRALLLDELDGDFTKTLLGAVGPEQQVPIIVTELRHLGGATARDVPEGSAVGGRTAAYSLSFVGVPDPNLFTTVLPPLVDGIIAQLAPWVSTDNNINFAGGLELQGSYETSWPAETSARLAEVRATYDPNSLFVYP